MPSAVDRLSVAVEDRQGEQAVTVASPDLIADAVAGYCGGDDDGRHDRQGNGMPVSQDAAEDDGCFAGEDEADEGCRFGKRECGHQRVGRGAVQIEERVDDDAGDAHGAGLTVGELATVAAELVPPRLYSWVCQVH